MSSPPPLPDFPASDRTVQGEHEQQPPAKRVRADDASEDEEMGEGGMSGDTTDVANDEDDAIPTESQPFIPPSTGGGRHLALMAAAAAAVAAAQDAEAQQVNTRAASLQYTMSSQQPLRHHQHQNDRMPPSPPLSTSTSTNSPGVQAPSLLGPSPAPSPPKSPSPSVAEGEQPGQQGAAAPFSGATITSSAVSQPQGDSTAGELSRRSTPVDAAAHMSMTSSAATISSGSSTPPSPSSISPLPPLSPELFLNVMLALPIRDRRTCRAVCRAWRSHLKPDSNVPMLWPDIVLPVHDPNLFAIVDTWLPSARPPSAVAARGARASPSTASSTTSSSSTRSSTSQPPPPSTAHSSPLNDSSVRRLDDSESGNGTIREATLRLDVVPPSKSMPGYRPPHYQSRGPGRSWYIPEWPLEPFSTDEINFRAHFVLDALERACVTTAPRSQEIAPAQGVTATVCRSSLERLTLDLSVNSMNAIMLLWAVFNRASQAPALFSRLRSFEIRTVLGADNWDVDGRLLCSLSPSLERVRISTAQGVSIWRNGHQVITAPPLDPMQGTPINPSWHSLAPPTLPVLAHLTELDLTGMTVRGGPQSPPIPAMPSLRRLRLVRVTWHTRAIYSLVRSASRTLRSLSMLDCPLLDSWSGEDQFEDWTANTMLPHDDDKVALQAELSAWSYDEALASAMPPPIVMSALEELSLKGSSTMSLFTFADPRQFEDYDDFIDVDGGDHELMQQIASSRFRKDRREELLPTPEMFMPRLKRCELVELWPQDDELDPMSCEAELALTRLGALAPALEDLVLKDVPVPLKAFHECLMHMNGTLRSLDLRASVGLTDVAIVNLHRYVPMLRELDVRDTGFAVQSLARLYRNMRDDAAPTSRLHKIACDEPTDYGELAAVSQDRMAFEWLDWLGVYDERDPLICSGPGPSDLRERREWIKSGKRNFDKLCYEAEKRRHREWFEQQQQQQKAQAERQQRQAQAQFVQTQQHYTQTAPRPTIIAPQASAVTVIKAQPQVVTAPAKAPVLVGDRRQTPQQTQQHADMTVDADDWTSGYSGSDDDCQSVSDDSSVSHGVLDANFALRHSVSNGMHVPNQQNNDDIIMPEQWASQHAAREFMTDPNAHAYLVDRDESQSPVDLQLGDS